MEQTFECFDFVSDAVDPTRSDLADTAFVVGREGPAALRREKPLAKLTHHRIFDQVHIAIAHDDNLQKRSDLRHGFRYFSIEGQIVFASFKPDVYLHALDVRIHEVPSETLKAGVSHQQIKVSLFVIIRFQS